MSFDAPQWGGPAPGSGMASAPSRTSDLRTKDTSVATGENSGTAATNKYIFRPTVVSQTAGAQSGNKALVLALHCPAGTGATIYNEWVNTFKTAFLDGSALSEVVDVVHLVPIELPGRSLRMKEPLITQMDDLAMNISSALEEYIDSVGLNDPAGSATYVCAFGHSLGGWIGFEVMRKLVAGGSRSDGGNGVSNRTHLCFIASAIRSPTLCGVENDIDSTAMHQLAEGEFWRAMERRYGANKDLEHPSVRQMMFPILKADFTVSETYDYDGGPLDLPLFVSGGREDVRYDHGMLAAWAECRGASRPDEFQVEMFDGGHNYLFSKAESMEEHVSWVLRRLKESVSIISHQPGGSVSGEEEEEEEAGDSNTGDDKNDAVDGHNGADHDDSLLEDMTIRTNRSDRVSLVSEIESSVFAHPGTTQTMSDVVDMDRDMSGMEESLNEMNAMRKGKDATDVGGNGKSSRKESNEPRCHICSLM